MTLIAAAELAGVLRAAIEGRAALSLVGRESWGEVYCGNVEFQVDGWRVTFFNDCGELDYVDSVTAPDGRAAEYGDWFDSGGTGADPIDLLSITGESNALLTLLESIERC